MAMLTHPVGVTNLNGVGASVAPDLHSCSSVKRASVSTHVARVVSGNFCSSSGRFSHSSVILSSKGKRLDVAKSVRSSLIVDDSAPGRASFPQFPLLESLDFDPSPAGRSSGGQVSCLPEDQDIPGLLDASAVTPESCSADVARPQPIVQGFADSPFTAEFAMDVTVGASAASEFEAMAVSVPMYRPKWIWFAKSAEEENLFIDRAINATIIGSAGILAVTKALTVDHDYWHGWTLLEILQYAPVHNWFAYEELLKTHPVLAKMIISGTVYSIGDWIAQCYEGKGVLEFNRLRMFRSGLVGFCLHGSLSHFYYHFCEWLFPFQGWWVLPLKVGFDQTVWSGIWNSIYFVTVGLLRLESPASIVKELRETFFPLLTAGWKLWPFAHLVTYGLVPVEQRLLWVDMVEIIWVTILAMYSNEKAEARIAVGEGIEITQSTADGAATESNCLVETVSDENKS